MGKPAFVALSFAAVVGCDPLYEKVDVPPAKCEPGGASVYPAEEGAWWRDHVVDEAGQADCPDKVISIGPLGHPPGRPDIDAWPARSERADRWGLRWQVVSVTGILRVADEWFDWDGHGITLDEYCPYKTRMLHGGSVCVGDHWKDQVKRARITPVGTDWQPCWSQLKLNPATCEATAVPDGCDVVVSDLVNECTTEAVDEVVVTPAGTFKTLRVRCLETVTTPGSPPGKPTDSTFWWARGVGKVSEHTPPASPEKLLHFCLPSSGCVEKAPDYPTMKAQCPP